jgi:hypothetical protein
MIFDAPLPCYERVDRPVSEVVHFAVLAAKYVINPLE